MSGERGTYFRDGKRKIGKPFPNKFLHILSQIIFSLAVLQELQILHCRLCFGLCWRRRETRRPQACPIPWKIFIQLKEIQSSYGRGEKDILEKCIASDFSVIYKTIIIYSSQEQADDKGTKVHFVKCHCPFDVLKYYAEELSFKAPLEVISENF